MIEKITKEIRKMVIDHFACHGETIISIKKELFGPKDDEEMAIKVRLRSTDHKEYVSFCTIAYDSHNEPYIMELTDGTEGEVADG